MIKCDKNAKTRVKVQKLTIKKAEEEEMCLYMVQVSRIPQIYNKGLLFMFEKKGAKFKFHHIK